MLKVIIAEKPSLARNIVAGIGKMNKKDGYFENSEYIVTWAFGHLFGLCDVEDYTGDDSGWNIDDLPFVPEYFRFTLKRNPKTKEVDSGVRKQFNTIKELVTRSDVSAVINAGDSDREGEIIIRIILQNIKGFSKPVMRLWMPDQTPETIASELRKMRDDKEYDSLADEGYARTYIDWLYGINLTRYVTLKSDSLLRIGRVVSPVIKAIYDRDMEIESFKPIKYLGILSKEKTNGQDVELLSKKTYSPDGKNSALALCKNYNEAGAIVSDINKEKKVVGAGKLYSLSKLQGALGKAYKMSLKESLEIVQKLYESGYVTYPRTNTEYLATAEKEKVAGIIGVLSRVGFPVKFKDSKTIFDDSKIESHSALTPTAKIPKEDSLSPSECKVYNAIRDRFIAVFCSEDCVVNRTVMTVSVGDYEKFVLKGDVVIQKGWLNYSLSDKKDKVLPDLSLGDKVNINFKPVEKETQPPAHYTLETFNNFLKNPFKKAGDTEDAEYKAIFSGVELGTEATRTGIIDKAIKDGNIELKSGVYYITDGGKFYVRTLEALKVDMSKEKTVELSQLLKKVYKGEVKIESCLDFTINEIKETLSHKNEVEVEGSLGVGKCPVCGGSIKKKAWGYGCSNYSRGCEFSISKKIAGKTIPEAQIKNLLTNGITDEIKGFKSKEGKEFSAKLKVADGKVAFAFSVPQETSLLCPCCGNKLKNDKWSWKCECGFSFNHEIAGKKMTEEFLVQLAENGTTEKIDGFKSKAGKLFSANLMLNKETKKVEFKFE